MHRQRLATGALLAIAMSACGDDGGETATTTGTTDVPPVSSTTGTSTGPGESTSGPTTPTTGDPTSTGDVSSTSTDPTTTTTTTDSTTGDETTAAVSDSTTTLTTDSTTGDPSGEPRCEKVLEAIVRDFSKGHPDFQSFSGAVDGLVLPDLGPDKKPVHAAAGPTMVTSGPENFKQWYTDVPGVNQAFPIQLELTEVMPGIYQYVNNTFFPIDEQGLGNEGFSHNYHFTTEIHTEFVYNGGEVFTFIGDDDLWTFINGKLAIDLGGVHAQLSESIDLDADAVKLGIVKGGTYTMDIFHAERHTVDSNFRIDTSIGCFIVPG